jgi:hypothetical protein
MTGPTGPSQVSSINFVVDGGGSAITGGTTGATGPNGSKGYIIVDYACTINSVTLLADQSGSIVMDIYKTSYSNFDAGVTHPVVGDSITASAKPTLSSAVKAQDSTLSGWTTAIAAGSVLSFFINSASTVTRVTLDLKVTRT